MKFAVAESALAGVVQMGPDTATTMEGAGVSDSLSAEGILERVVSVMRKMQRRLGQGIIETTTLIYGFCRAISRSRPRESIAKKH